MGMRDVDMLLAAAAQLAVRDWYLTKAAPAASWERYLRVVEVSAGAELVGREFSRLLADFVRAAEPPGSVRAAQELLHAVERRLPRALGQAVLVVAASTPVLRLQASEQDLADLRETVRFTVVPGPEAALVGRTVVALDDASVSRELAEELWASAERTFAPAAAAYESNLRAAAVTSTTVPERSRWSWRWLRKNQGFNDRARLDALPRHRGIGVEGASWSWPWSRPRPGPSSGHARRRLSHEYLALEGAREEDAFVNVGLASAAEPHHPVPPDGISPGGQLWLWVQVGPRTDDAIVGPSKPVALMHLPHGELVDVMVFPDHELAVQPQGRIGTIRMSHDHRFDIVEAVPAPGSPPSSEPRLFAAVRAPARSGSWRIRIVLVVRGTIIHVEQLTLRVGAAALDAGLDPGVVTTFRLLSDLNSRRAFASLVPPTLTIYENHGTTTHDFSFLLPGAPDASSARQVQVDTATITTYLEQARAQLRLASWGSSERYTSARQPRYVLYGEVFTGNATMVKEDLVGLALVGRRLWLDLVSLLGARDLRFMQELQSTMRSPGTVQLAIRGNPSHVLPLQVLYDAPLDTTREGDLQLCGPSLHWLDQPTGEPPCIAAGCPSWDDRLVVCISGFWGYRHRVTTTLSNPRSSSEDLAVVATTTPPIAVAAVAQDPRVARYWGPHRERLRTWLTLVDPVSRSVADTVTALKAGPLTIVYFLAHLMDADDSPYISLDALGGLDGDTLFDQGVELDGRPLVFLNTCESAGASPERLLGLIDRFLIHGADAAVGTEITVFVDLATQFGEAFMQRFAAGADLAEATRAARVAVLAQLNPIGLAYVCYGLHNFHLEFGVTPAGEGVDVLPGAG